MRVHHPKALELSANIQDSLRIMRRLRHFDPQQYLAAKSYVLLQYMKKFSLDTCVVAVSGGVDSALVLSIVHYAKRNSPIIKNIVALTLPVLDSQSATNQSQSVLKAQELCDSLGLALQVIDVTASYRDIHQQMDKSLAAGADHWARGQLASYARTPIIYYSTSVMSAMGYKAIVVGTTNRDEGAYLGYVGKASDGMVDVQLISDLHKSEVFCLARYLGVPQSILTARPSGDMYDGRCDEEVFGASYDAVEFYLNYLNLSAPTRDALTQDWQARDWGVFEENKKALEHLHSYNAHKYLIGSPAIHLDIMDSSVRGGWIEGVHSGLFKQLETKKLVFTHRFVGFAERPPQFTYCQASPSSQGSAENTNLATLGLEQIKIDELGNTITTIANLIEPSTIEAIEQWAQSNRAHWSDTNEYGRQLKVTSDTAAEPLRSEGSQRLSFYSPEFAQVLTERLKIAGIDHFHYFKDTEKTNFSPYRVWKFIGLNPMFRVLRYTENQTLVAHYDDSYIENERQKSLMTLLLIIDNDCEGGATRFIKDEQDRLELGQRDFSDWTRTAGAEEVRVALKLPRASAIIFPHRILHDAQAVTRGEKTIVRTELMFERCEL